MANNSTTRILALDDDPFTLKLLSRMLENLGYTAVSTRDNGRAALELVDSPDARPDLILLDLNMPEMDGVEFVRRLVEHRYTGSLILSSGEDEQMLLAAEKLVRAHNIPMLGSLRKPAKPEGLAALLKKWTPPYQGHAPAANLIRSAEDLRAAIANGELANYYQPKVSLSTGRVVGVEALVRWNHPRDGMVLPSKFIGVAESHGLIKDLTRMVLTDALAQLKVWQQAELSLQLSVNVSRGSLASLDFVDFVAGLVAEAGVPPQEVMLEVSESWIPMNDLRAPLETLARLRLKRFSLSIDEFGTGYSSLAQLRDLPFDEIKIDRSFVHHASTDKKVRAKYDACLDMARQLGMEVVAVGVEEIGDWDMLRSTGCDLAQGHFIARPMPAADLPGWIKIWQVRMQNEFAAISKGGYPP
ncbi:MAG TPA: EAL domain-containing response regulator [Gallionella sp.]|nr:EAL domain-containing response regulator [Gallionella sp.]